MGTRLLHRLLAAGRAAAQALRRLCWPFGISARLQSSVDAMSRSGATLRKRATAVPGVVAPILDEESSRC